MLSNLRAMHEKRDLQRFVPERGGQCYASGERRAGMVVHRRI